MAVLGHEQKPCRNRGGCFHSNERTFTRGSAQVSNSPKAEAHTYTEIAPMAPSSTKLAMVNTHDVQS